MGAGGVGPAQTSWPRLQELARSPGRAALGLGLLLLLVPIGGMLGVMVAYVTALIMTIVLTIGLGIAGLVLAG
jgi:hypothetical protein